MGYHSARCLGRPLGVEENIGLSVTHFLHTANLHLRVVTVDPKTCKTNALALALKPTARMGVEAL